ncbi:MAG: efflux RND transporter periplasmic adaptor subunit [Thermoanaerobaculales bacterium]|jgi:HlyD family secretion protein|nr:efflux RND transporter periplasmic adaptor subunit [Thermoanaerobaculales bacterium]
MRKVMRLLALAVVVAGAAGAIYAWVGSRDDNGSGITLVEAEIGSITEKALAVGQIEPRERFQVKSKISGIVHRCYAEVGDQVRAGDALFEIAPDPTPQELLNVDHSVRSSEASFLKARGDFERGQELYTDGLMSKGDLDALRETYELARIARQQASDNRDLTRSGRVSGGETEVETIIRTPASGTLLSRAVNVGDPVVPLTSYQPGTELAAVADMSDLIFKGTVDEIDVGKITVGMPCRIKVGALPEAPVTGRLSRIAPQAQKNEGATLFDVEIELDPGQDVLLRAGYSANADVVIREKNDILLIPERLVLFEGEATFVEVPGEGPEAEPRKVAVELGLSDGLNVEIASGLAAGDQVVQRPPKEIS